MKLEFQVLNLANRINVLRIQSAFTAAGTPTQIDFTRHLQLGAGFNWQRETYGEGIVFGGGTMQRFLFVSASARCREK
jgi:hypothetical protein